MEMALVRRCKLEAGYYSVVCLVHSYTGVPCRYVLTRFLCMFMSVRIFQHNLMLRDAHKKEKEDNSETKLFCSQKYQTTYVQFICSWCSR